MEKKQGLINPYQFGPPITKEDGFYGREDLVEAVVKHFTNGQGNAIVLHGQRRIGKTSLLHRLKRDKMLGQHYWPIFLNLQAHQGYSSASILYHLAKTIVRDTLKLDIPYPNEASFKANRDQFQRYQRTPAAT